jgi:hypothetical protein
MISAPWPSTNARKRKLNLCCNKSDFSDVDTNWSINHWIKFHCRWILINSSASAVEISLCADALENIFCSNAASCVSVIHPKIHNVISLGRNYGCKIQVWSSLSTQNLPSNQIDDLII